MDDFGEDSRSRKRMESWPRRVSGKGRSKEMEIAPASSRECKYKVVAFPANIFARRARGRQPISIWNEIFVLGNRDNRGDGQDSLLVFLKNRGK